MNRKQTPEELQHGLLEQLKAEIRRDSEQGVSGPPGTWRLCMVGYGLAQNALEVTVPEAGETTHQYTVRLHAALEGAVEHFRDQYGADDAYSFGVACAGIPTVWLQEKGVWQDEG